MTELKDVCRYIRSKNAGPFWVTIDLFFHDAATYQYHRDDMALSAASIARIYDVAVEHVKIFHIDALNVTKISIPRSQAQGGALERDMHSGQQFVPMLSLQLQ